MIQSIAIQAYFDRMRSFFTRQGFDSSLKIVYGADAEGAQRLLEQDLSDKEMDRKSASKRDTIRSSSYSYIFWNRSSLENVMRRSINVRDGVTSQGSGLFKKTVSASFGMACTLVSNSANFIEDFSEAFAAEYQNMHNVPVNIKFGYSDHSPVSEGGFDTDGLSFTIIQDLGTEELVSFKTGNLFSYTWDIKLYLNLVSEFAHTQYNRLKGVVVDLYNSGGVPLASMKFDGTAEWKTHTATDGTTLIVPKHAYIEQSVQ